MDYNYTFNKAVQQTVGKMESVTTIFSNIE